MVRAARAAGNTAGKEQVAAPQLTWFRQVRKESRSGVRLGIKVTRRSNVSSLFRIAFATREKVHEIAGRLTVIIIFERHFEVRG